MKRLLFTFPPGDEEQKQEGVMESTGGVCDCDPVGKPGAISLLETSRFPLSQIRQCEAKQRWKMAPPPPPPSSSSLSYNFQKHLGIFVIRTALILLIWVLDYLPPQLLNTAPSFTQQKGLTVIGLFLFCHHGELKTTPFPL